MNEAFVYSWKNKTTGRLYVGYHKGLPTDGYVCSSKKFLLEYKENPANFERFIIANGTTNDMRKLETAILTQINAADDEDFYNQHNNNSQNGVISHSLKTKNKIRASRIGKKASVETRKRMSDSHKARWAAGFQHSTEAKSKMLAANLGSKRSEQTKHKIRSTWHASRILLKHL